MDIFYLIATFNDKDKLCSGGCERDSPVGLNRSRKKPCMVQCSAEMSIDQTIVCHSVKNSPAEGCDEERNWISMHFPFRWEGFGLLEGLKPGP